jgi:hypothetical protein
MPENLQGATTTGYAVEFEHFRSEGIEASPIAGPDPQNASLTRLHAPFEKLMVYWTATREGAPPILPSSKSFYQNYNRVLLRGGRRGVVTPTLGGHIWEAAGFFEFVVVGPEGLDSSFHLAKCPWEGTDVSDFYIPAQNFQAGIIDGAFYGPLGGLSINPDVPLLAPIEGPINPPPFLNPLA